MRPIVGCETFQPRSRKPSLAGQPLPILNAHSTSPVTFFLRRGSQGNDVSSSVDATPAQSTPPSRSPTSTSENSPQPMSTLSVRNDEDEAGAQSPRRRSTMKAKEVTVPQGSSSAKGYIQALQHEPLTPLLVPSDTSSLPSSPKSASIRSLRPSEAESAIGDAGSQAILSSEDEEVGPEASVRPADPQLIMPSIKMPSRRPFTERGKRIGNFKILIAGSKGVGKTSLIRSIVQTCEDIVHIDPLPIGSSYPARSASNGQQALATREQPHVLEINASTRPYPFWWSKVEDSRILRRRKSMGDTVLDRNLCFVETGSRNDFDTISAYMITQLQKAVEAPTTSTSEFASLLGGSGGSLVDVIFYMLSKDTFDEDILQMKALSELGNVVPIISKADLLPPEDIETLKIQTRMRFDATALPWLPAFGEFGEQNEKQSIPGPYAVSSAPGPDHETMDASLLMSPDYVQPLAPSQLTLLVQQILETDTIPYLRHSAAKKLISWQTHHPRSVKAADPALPLSSYSPWPSSFVSVSDSGVLVPLASDLLPATTSNSSAMVRLAEHTQQEERLAQARLNAWAADLQNSLQRERQRFEKLAKAERAVWLVERMGEEARDGRLSGLLNADKNGGETSNFASAKYAPHDPMGLLRWSDHIKTRGWVALQVIGSFGMIGGIAFWLAKTWGLTSAINEWASSSRNSVPTGWNDAQPVFVR